MDQPQRTGPGADPTVDYREVCVLAQAMTRAEVAFRDELAGQTLADVKATVEARHPEAPDGTRSWLRAAG